MSVSEQSPAEQVSTPAEHSAPASLADRLDAVWSRRKRANRRRLLGIGVFAVIGIIIPFLTSNDYEFTVLGNVLLYALAGIGFYFVLGLSGQFAFSQAAIFGLGAYSSAWAERLGANFWVGLLVAIVIVGVVAAVIRLLLWRASHFYFAIATLAFAQVSSIIFLNWTAFTGLSGDASINTVPSFFGVDIDSPEAFYWLFFGFVIVALLISYLITVSKRYRETVAVRDRPDAAAGLGISVLRNQLFIFVLGSLFAGVAGVLFASSQGFIAPDSFGLNLGIDLFVVVVIGGMYSVWGAILGAIFVVVLPEVTRGLSDQRTLILAILLVVVIVLLPRGLVGIVQLIRDTVTRIVKRGRNVA
ncbi:MAG: branched-chain amino acid ABC transporter permease [Actinomycetota bacterium]